MFMPAKKIPANAISIHPICKDIQKQNFLARIIISDVLTGNANKIFCKIFLVLEFLLSLNVKKLYVYFKLSKQFFVNFNVQDLFMNHKSYT